MNILITFGGAQYDTTTKDLVELGPNLGADVVWVYDDLWLTQQPFHKQNKWLWEHPHKRGFGWYCWKPFVIWNALSRCKDGDVVLFVDADCRPLANFSMLFEECRRIGGIMLFSAETCFHRSWCKRDCYIVMGQDQDHYWYDLSAVARFALFEKGPWKATQFLMEWLTYAVNPLANTFDQSRLGADPPDFIEHRAEQSILTNLAYKYGLKLHREMDAGGEVRSVRERDRELYGQLFEQDNPNNTPDCSNNTLEVIGSRYRNV